MAKKHANKIERRLFISGLALLIAIFGTVILSLVFLSGQMLSAFSGDAGVSAQTTKFDTEGYKRLNLE